MTHHKFNPKYQQIYNEFNEYHKTGDYHLDWIDEIYLPFWICKQKIYVQKELKIDSLSEILLSLVNKGVKKHSEISQFLGVAEDDFVLSQLDFLLREGFLEEAGGSNNHYEITHEGRSFLKKEKNVSTTIEADSVDYMVNDLDYLAKEKYEAFYDVLGKSFFDKNQAIDESNNKNFSGYKLIETHKLKNIGQYHIPHENKPRLHNINQSDFIEFYNANNADIFYDFSDDKIETHKRSIKFYVLYYQDKDGDIIIEIRHCRDTVNKYDKKHITLEETLSAKVKQYIEKTPEFIESLKQ